MTKLFHVTNGFTGKLYLFIQFSLRLKQLLREQISRLVSVSGIAWWLMSWCGFAMAQSEPRATMEWQLTTENDVYLFDISDRYYTNGFQLDWRRVLPAENALLRIGKSDHPLFRKAIFGVKVNQNIYSPQEIFNENIDQIDRPYAGWLYAGGSLTLFMREKTVLTGSVDLGVTGPESGGEWAQKHWHALFDMDEPINWGYQIRNAVVGHVNVLVQRQLATARSADLISETVLQAGSLLTNVRQGLTMRIGAIEPLYHSLYTNSRLDRTVSLEQYQRHEFFLFVNGTVERVFHNGLLNGELQNGQSLPIRPGENWVVHYRWGVQYGNHRWNLVLAVNHLTPEFEGGKHHNYGSIGIGVRL